MTYNNSYDIKLFDKNKIRKWQMVYITLSILYLLLLISAFFIKLYRPDSIKLVHCLFLIVSILSFIAQGINITCNVLNIRNTVCKPQSKNKFKHSRESIKDRMNGIVAIGFIGESIGFFGIACIMLILGTNLMSFNSVTLPLRIFNIVSSLFSIMYGSVFLIKSIGSINSNRGTRSNLHASWKIFNSFFLLFLGWSNFVYEAVLCDILKDLNYPQCDLSLLVKTSILCGYAIVLISILLSQVFDLNREHELDFTTGEMELDDIELQVRNGCCR